MARRTRMLREQLDKALQDKKEAQDLLDRFLGELVQQRLYIIGLLFTLERDLNAVQAGLATYAQRLPVQAPTDGQYSYLKICIQAELDHWKTLLESPRKEVQCLIGKLNQNKPESSASE